ncbi:MAG: outer membrane beta-barrel protein [Bdellovibrionota bacterium]
MKFLIVLALTVSSAFAQAFEDYGVEAGFRSQNFTADTTGVSTSSEIGYQLGVSGAVPVSGAFVFRSGLFYTERPLKYSVTGGDATIKLTYFDIPLTFGYKFSDYALVYLGPVLAVKLSDNVKSSGTLSGTTSSSVSPKGTIVPIVLGAAFRFAPQIGANVFFEMTSGEAATGAKDLRAVGANLIVYLD